jgi:hypothetical protein
MKLSLLLIIAGFVYNLNAQSVYRQQGKIATYNIVFSSLTAGIGSCINKPEKESYSRAFIRGASRGVIGGALTFTGKKLTRLIVTENSYYYGWLSKAVHSTGTSIVRNASSHKRFMEEYVTEVGFVQLGYSFNTARPSAKIILSHLGGFAAILAMKGSLDFEKSLKLGHIYFNAHKKTADEKFNGQNIYGIMQINVNSPHIMETTAHELIHTMQTNEFLSFGTYIDKPYESMPEKFKIFAPELITSYIIFSGIEQSMSTYYSRRISEFEAYSLSTNKFVWWF